MAWRPPPTTTLAPTCGRCRYTGNPANASEKHPDTSLSTLQEHNVDYDDTACPKFDAQERFRGTKWEMPA